MTAAEVERAQSSSLAHNLRLSTRVISAHIPEVRLEQALDLVTGLVPTHFVTIGLIDEKNPQRVVFGQSRAVPLHSSHTAPHDLGGMLVTKLVGERDYLSCLGLVYFRARHTRLIDAV